MAAKIRKKRTRKKLPPIVPGLDGLVEVVVLQERLGREVGQVYKVDPRRARKLLEFGYAELAGVEKDG